MLRKINILVINDRSNITNLLQNDYQVTVATNGSSVIHMIEKEQSDIILFDIDMSNTYDIKTLQKIYNNFFTKEIPMILLTDDDCSDYLIEFFDLGLFDYINKPIESKAFIFKIAFLAKLIRKTKEDKNKQRLLEQYKNIVDRRAIVSKTDKHGIITYANDKFCEMSGYTKEELLGKQHSIIRHPDMPSVAFEELWKNIKSSKYWFGKVKNRKKNGDFYYVDTMVVPILDDYGDTVEYIALRYDITELERYKDLLKDELSTTNKNLEDNLNYMKQYEEAISSVTAILKTDINNIIIHANSTFCELIGYRINELIGQDYTQLRDERHRLIFDYENIRNEFKNKKTVKKILTNIIKDGKKLYMNTFFYPIIDNNSNVIEYLQIMYDVTEIVSLNDEIIDTQKEIILTMSVIGETRSKETGLHVKRVAEYSYLLAKLSGLNKKSANTIKQASPMHDIGKVGIPDNILNKPAKLSIGEFEIIKTHSELGYEMLKHSRRDLLKTAATIAYTHHEKYDGSGYPNGLVGENIPIEGRLTAIADVFDALGSDRIYKKAWELEKIIDFFKEEKSRHFDPVLVDLFLQNIDDFLVIRNRYSGVMIN